MMPSFAELSIESVICPICGQQTTVPRGLIKFQWGKIKHNYQLDQPIVWLRDRDETVIPSFAVVAKKHWFWGIRFEWNCGEPIYRDVYVWDSDPHVDDFPCSNCGEVIPHLVIEIRNNIITNGHAFTNEYVNQKLGDIQGADIVIINDDGTFTPRPDWIDVSLK